MKKKEKKKKRGMQTQTDADANFSAIQTTPMYTHTPTLSFTLFFLMQTFTLSIIIIYHTN